MAIQKKTKVPLHIYDSYMAMIRNSVGTKLFRNLFFRINGKSLDVLDNGDLSCAVFVTSILYLLRLISDLHTTVVATIKDLRKSGWQEIKKPKVGSIILWGYKMGDDGAPHMHVGFYMGRKLAISNNSKIGMPSLHHWTFGVRGGKPKRKILAVYWHSKLDH